MSTLTGNVADVTTTLGCSTLPVIELAHPMPGFPEALRFTLEHLDEAGVLGELRSLDQAGLKFLTVPSSTFYPDYVPVIDDETVAALEIEDVNDVLVLLIVHAGPALATTTVNMLAPMIVNTTIGRGMQVILDDASLAVDAPLLP
ncbi:flagellar assembly protein FliW [Nocardioides sp. Kera G14]|uniref:flagellar assembly protein FliW n=1 Tax=Nocardioides sp. Kera G14 TaxID=2884264 RepID=UPI001D112438|nr:flagellar assembly protein FliW [Nocardioides sp. Kera G14]UDY24090.1 flagellar assembly protein FliW [Nocardioides sp. Kera G14]